MKKKLLSITLASTMALGMMACAAPAAAPAAGAAPAAAPAAEAEAQTEAAAETGAAEEAAPAAGEIKDIYIFAPIYMSIPEQESIDAVMAEVNKTMNPLGVNVNLEFTSASVYNDELAMKIAGQEQVDLVGITDNRYSGYIQSGSLMPLDDLLEKYGQDIIAAYGGDDQLGWLLNATKVSGVRYAIPVMDNKFQQDYAVFNVPLLEKYNLDASTVKSYKDMDALLSVIHENEPGIKPVISGAIMLSGLTPFMLGVPEYENLGDGIGVLMGEDNWDVVDVFETEEYENLCRDMHAWFEAGYISEDITTSNETSDTYWKTGNAFSYLQSATTVSEENNSDAITAQYGIESIAKQIMPSKATFLKYLNAIPSSSKNPEGAMIFLNELYKNADLVNTLYYGVEGKDWTMEGDLIKGVEGSTWFKNCGTCLYFMFGNYYLSKDTTNTGAGIVQTGYDIMLSCDKNRSLGFYFDSSNVSTQYTAVQNVLNEYRKGLEYGILDPDVELPNFINKLKAAGIDDIIAEKQAQLDAWAEANGKK